MTGRSASSSGNKGVLAWCGANRHFVVASLFLATSTVAWYSLGAFPVPDPVPWPRGVEVDGTTCRNTSLPTVFGKYRRVEDGELYTNEDGTPKKDGQPDGEITIGAETLEALKIGTGKDKARVGSRESNWYVSRVYVDTTGDALSAEFKHWRLSVYFYTGVSDRVPHVGEICLAAAGATIIEPANDKEKFKDFLVDDSSKLRSSWDKSVRFKRTRWEHRPPTGGMRQYVQYYVFSMNDDPVTDRYSVRLKLANPWIRHSYYAKIEFGPTAPIRDIDRADEAAERFMAHFFPHVINALPSREAIDTLDTTN